MATPIPSNLARFSLEELVLITGAGLCGERFSSVQGVETDTRAMLEGKLFVALDGATFDGHAFVSRAMASGAIAAVVGRPISEANVPQFVVSSPLETLGALGGYHRKRWGGRACAIVGSAGKTTTRATTEALIAAANCGLVHATPGNLNNRIGVPRVLLGLGPEHRFAVIEVGTNLRGEVGVLADVVAPDVAVLTLVDWEHAEGIGDLNAIEQEEGDMLVRVAPTGVAIANGDDSRALRQLERATCKNTVTFGRGRHCDYRVIERRLDGMRQWMRIDRPHGGAVELQTHIMGVAGTMTWAAGLAAAEATLSLPMTPQQISSAVAALGSGEDGRFKLRELNDGTLLIDDSYNSNPVSARSSIAAARELAVQRQTSLVLVLGEMRELGTEARRAHLALVDELEESDSVVAVAGDARLLAEAATRRGIDAEFADDATVAADLAVCLVRSGDVVLVKGSRGVGLDRVVEALVGAKGVTS